MSVVELDSVSKRYGDTVALEQVSLTVDLGQVVVLVGPNGAGKTTLVRIACALLGADSGTVRVAGVDARSRPAAARHHVAFVPQGAAPDLNLSPYEHVFFYLLARDVPRRQARQRSLEVLEALDLTGCRDRLVHTLSGGYQRRVLIAMCMAARPRVLVLDEPTTALDPEIRRQTWRQLDELRPDSAILVTTHDMAEAEVIADRIVLLSAGRVVAADTTKRLIARLPMDRKVVVDAAAEQLSALWPEVRVERLAGRSVLLPSGPGELKEWVNRLTGARMPFAVEPCRLEDVYFRLLVGAPDNADQQ